MKRSAFILLAFLGLTLASCEFYAEEVIIVDYDPRDAFLGTFDTEEYSETFDSYAYYDMHIFKSGEYHHSVFIENFYGSGLDVIADVDGDRLIIPRQDVDGYEIRGSGRITGNRLSLSYTVIDFLDYSIPKDYVDVLAWR